MGIDEKPHMNNQATAAVATFAGGCFWCMVGPFEKTPGVIKVESGYANGTGSNPTYQDYAQKGYVEAIQITFDPRKISYDTLLSIFWRQIDPTDSQGQFVDRGTQYHAAIYYHNEAQKEIAYASKKKLESLGKFSKPIVTEIAPYQNFYAAEQYHQNYHQKNPIRYNFYRYRSGRDQFLQKVWGYHPMSVTEIDTSSATFQKPSDKELRLKLTPLQYNVTQNSATEPAFANAYADNKEPGIYVDIVSGEPLFSSLDKFDSGTGWPSFSKPLEPDNIVEKVDKGWLGTRTEVRSKYADSHLGHVFKDGPKPTGLRYCMNSAALRFIPVAELEQEGYGDFKKLFE